MSLSPKRNNVKQGKANSTAGRYLDGNVDSQMAVHAGMYWKARGRVGADVVRVDPRSADLRRLLEGDRLKPIQTVSEVTQGNQARRSGAYHRHLQPPCLRHRRIKTRYSYTAALQNTARYTLD